MLMVSHSHVSRASQYGLSYILGIVMSRLGLAGSWLGSGTGADQNGS